MDDTVDFYHYTDEDGKDAIEESGKILESNPRAGDAVFGQGVYGNSMDPEEFSKEELAANNYDRRAGFWEEFLDTGRVDYAIKVTLSADKVEKIEHDARDILVHKGDIDLSQHPYEVLEVPDEYESDSDSDGD